MDSPLSEIHEDEVIADSEDEMEGLEKRAGDEIPGYYPTSSASAFTITSHAFEGKAVSSIAEFTVGPSHAIPNHRAKEARNDADTSISTAFTNPQYDDFGPVGTIADRAKTRQRTQSKPKGMYSDVIELTSDEDDDELSPRPSTSRKVKASPKTKAKPKPKPKAEDKEKDASAAPKDVTTTNIPNTTSDPPTNPRPRPRPRPIAKRPKTTHENDIADPGAAFAYPFARNRPPAGPPTSTPPLGPSSHGGPEVPIATSPSAMPPPQCVGGPSRVTISHLPPSDPPGSSFPTRFHEEEDFGGYGEHHGISALPPIETLDQGRDSSPDSMFDENAEEIRQLRQSGERTSQEGVDELETSPVRIGVPETTMPPTFFAGSSSSSIGGGHRHRKLIGGPEHEVVDLTLFPTLDPTAAVQPKPKASKAKKPKKKDKEMADLDLDAFAMPLPVLDEDDADKDFDPAGDGSGKKRAKAKPKRGKEKKKASPQVVEVVITSKKTKGKKTGAQETSSSSGADKGPSAMMAPKGKGKQQDKEVFKSREFIEDSDDDADPLRLTDNNAFTEEGSNPLTLEERNPEQQADPVNSTSSSAPSASRSATSAAQEARTKKKGNKKEEESSAPSDPARLGRGVTSNNTTSSSASPSSRSHPSLKTPSKDASASSSLAKDLSESGMPQDKTKPKSKKRKSIVDSAAEDDEFRDDAQEVVTKKKQRKGKNVVLSDDEEVVEVEAEKAKSMSKGKGKEKAQEGAATKQSKRISKLVVSDEEQDMPVDGDGDSFMDEPHPEERQPTPEGTGKEKRKARKENVSPAPPAPSSKPGATPQPQSGASIKPNPDGSTPLYARYEVAPRRGGPSMSELIRRANSMPGSPFPAPSVASPFARKNTVAAKAHPGTPTASSPLTTTYSPYMKSSRRLLSRIVPLHPNRKTPPPPPPPPPPRKKSKKEIEMEEKWEEELVDSVGGLEVWAAMEEGERKEMRKVKFERERGGWDD